MELDGTTTGSVDSIDVGNDLTGVPHIYHRYVCPIRADLINRGEEFPDILPGDLLVFFVVVTISVNSVVMQMK